MNNQPPIRRPHPQLNQIPKVGAARTRVAQLHQIPIATAEATRVGAQDGAETVGKGRPAGETL